MTEREEFEKWLNTLDKQTLVTMAAKQALTIEELQAAMKSAATEWISVSDKTPKHELGKWSDPAIAMSDTGLVFRLSYCGGWQCTGDFMSTGSSKVTHWVPMPKFAGDDNVS